MDTYQEIAGRPFPGIDSMRCLGQSEDNEQDLFQEVRRTGRIGWPVCRRINDMVSIYLKQSFFLLCWGIYKINDWVACAILECVQKRQDEHIRVTITVIAKRTLKSETTASCRVLTPVKGNEIVTLGLWKK